MKLVKHSNYLIMAYYDMSSMQKNLFYMLLSLLKEKDGYALTKYQININELEELRGVTIRSDEIFKAANDMTSCGFTIYDPQQGQHISVSPIASARYEKGKRSVYLEIEPKMLPFLFKIKDNYSTYQLKDAIALNSKYSKRIFEMMAQFQDTGWLTLSLEEFEKRLALIDLKTGKKKFPMPALLKKYVLDVAQKELQELTDLSFTYQIQKGDEYNNIVFKIHVLHSNKNKLSRKNGKYPNPELEGDALTQYRLMTEELHWLSKRQAYALVTTLPTQQLWSCIDRMKGLVMRGESVKPTIYFGDLLKNYLQKNSNSPNLSINSSVEEFSQKEPVTITEDEQEKAEGGGLVVRMLSKFNYDPALIDGILKKVPRQEISQALDEIDQEPHKSGQVVNYLISKIGGYPRNENQSVAGKGRLSQSVEVNKKLQLRRKLNSELNLTYSHAMAVVDQTSLQELDQTLNEIEQEPDRAKQILSALVDRTY